MGGGPYVIEPGGREGDREREGKKAIKIREVTQMNCLEAHGAAKTTCAHLLQQVMLRTLVLIK